MEALFHLVCIALTGFALLAQPAVAQEANTTLPLTHPGQVLQGDNSQICPAEQQRNIVRSEVDNAILSLFRESVFSPPTRPGNEARWRRVAYLNMYDPSQQCPSV